MFREMRRKKQILDEATCIEILNKKTAGVLAVEGDHNYPYAVPLSYVYSDGKIYFHCAKTGHKMDAIARNSKVSFCVIDQDLIVPEELTTYFRSVIVFGKIRVLEDEVEKRNAIEKLAIRYWPNQEEAARNQVIEKQFASFSMLELSIDHMSGKEAIELVRAKSMES